jgi:hypothetical protein
MKVADDDAMLINIGMAYLILGKDCLLWAFTYKWHHPHKVNFYKFSVVLH